MATGGKNFGKEPVPLSPVASEARPPREDIALASDSEPAPPTRPKSVGSGAVGLACRMPASWRGACKRRGQERAGAGVFIAGLQAPCQCRRHMMHNAMLYTMNRPVGLKETGGTV